MKDLSEDVLLSIFHKLPSKSLGVCMCVNKEWRAIINKNASFLSSPHNNGKNGMYLIFWTYDNQFRLYVDNDNDKLESYKLLTIPFKPFTTNTYFPNPLAICNGVLCLTTGKESGSDIILWNPFIQKMLTLPKPPNLTPHDRPVLKLRHLGFDTMHLGFDFDSLTNDYKILKIITFKDDLPDQAEVFSLRNNSWKDISQIAPTHHIWLGIFHQNLNGAIHILCSDCISDLDKYPHHYTYTIVGFDVNADVFREFKLPKQFDTKEAIDSDVYKESYLSICCSNWEYLEIWLMKDYGNTESWENIWKFDYRAIIGNLDEYGYNFNVWGLGSCNNGEVLWCRTPPRYGSSGATITSFDLTDGEAQRLDFDDYKVVSKLVHNDEKVRYFGPSLLLLDDVNAVNSSITRITSSPSDMFDFSKCLTLLFEDNS